LKKVEKELRATKCKVCLLRKGKNLWGATGRDVLGGSRGPFVGAMIADHNRGETSRVELSDFKGSKKKLTNKKLGRRMSIQRKQLSTGYA